MKYRITAAFAAALCLIGTVSCGQTGYGYQSAPDMTETNPGSTADETETAEETELSEETEITEEETEPVTETLYYTESRFNKGLLVFNSEVPAEAVVKVDKKTISITDNTVTSHMIYYKDSHDRELMVQSVNDETGEIQLYSKNIYEYDENGDTSYECHMVPSVVTTDTTKVPPISYLETFFIPHEDNPKNYTVINVTNGEMINTCEFALDESGHSHVTTHSDYTSPITPIIDEEGKKYDYDVKGNVIAVYETKDAKKPFVTYGYTYDDKGRMIYEYCYDEKGKLENTYKYAYDDEGRIISQTKTIDNYDSECYKYKIEEESYEYDPNCGKKSGFTRKQFTGDSVDEPPTLDYSEEYIYDGSGNLIKTTYFNSGVQSATFDTYEYEYLG